MDTAPGMRSMQGKGEGIPSTVAVFPHRQLRKTPSLRRSQRAECPSKVRGWSIGPERREMDTND